MIFSEKLLKHPQLRLPSVPDVFKWNIRTREDSVAFLVLESKEGIFASHKLVHPNPPVEDEVEYIARISRAAMSLRWELDTQLELEAADIARRSEKEQA